MCDNEVNHVLNVPCPQSMVHGDVVREEKRRGRSFFFFCMMSIR